MKRVIGMILLALCLLGELFFTLSFVVSRLDGYQTSTDMGDTEQLGLGGYFVLGAVSSVWGITAICRKHKHVLLSVLLMKCTLFLGLLCVLMLSRSHDAAFAFAVLALAMGFLTWLSAWSGAGHRITSPAVYAPDPPPEKPLKIYETFRADKAEYAFDAAKAEYLQMTGKTQDELTADDERRIYRYAGTPIAYFLIWLIRRGHMSAEFLQECPPEDIRGFMDKTLNPAEFLERHMDLALLREDIGEETLPFVDWYYGNDPEYIIYQLAAPRYRFDYWAAVRNPEKRWYCNEITWERYELLEERLDTRYRRFCSERELDHESKLFKDAELPLFGCSVHVLLSPGVPEDYAERCIAHMQSHDPLLLNGCLKAASAFRIRMANAGQEPSAYFHPTTMRILHPYGEEPAYQLTGTTTVEDMPQFALCIRGEQVLFAEPRELLPSPWGSYGDREYALHTDISANELFHLENEHRARMEQRIGEGALVRLFLPTDKEIYVLPHILTLKEECDCIIEAMQICGETDTYTCKPHYLHGHPVPRGLLIESHKGSRKTFTEWLAMF